MRHFFYLLLIVPHLVRKSCEVATQCSVVSCDAATQMAPRMADAAAQGVRVATCDAATQSSSVGARDASELLWGSHRGLGLAVLGRFLIFSPVATRANPRWSGRQVSIHLSSIRAPRMRKFATSSLPVLRARSHAIRSRGWHFSGGGARPNVAVNKSWPWRGPRVRLNARRYMASSQRATSRVARRCSALRASHDQRA